jgi:hypothetical protein
MRGRLARVAVDQETHRVIDGETRVDMIDQREPLTRRCGLAAEYASLFRLYALFPASERADADRAATRR